MDDFFNFEVSVAALLVEVIRLRCCWCFFIGDVEGDVRLFVFILVMSERLFFCPLWQSV